VHERTTRARDARDALKIKRAALADTWRAAAAQPGLGPRSAEAEQAAYGQRQQEMQRAHVTQMNFLLDQIRAAANAPTGHP